MYGWVATEHVSTQTGPSISGVKLVKSKMNAYENYGYQYGPGIRPVITAECPRSMCEHMEANEAVNSHDDEVVWTYGFRPNGQGQGRGAHVSITLEPAGGSRRSLMH